MGGVLAALLSVPLAGPAAAAAGLNGLWAGAKIAPLRTQIVFDVDRPPIAATVTLPVPGTQPGTLPVAALDTAESGISGTVTVTGGGRTTTLPASLLRAQALPGALSLTYGEQSLDLPPQGDATIALRLGPGESPRSQTVSFSVRAGSQPSPPPPTPQEAAFVAELNAFRTEAGVPPVRLSAALTAAALAHAAFVSGHSGLYASGVSVHDEPVAWSRIAGWSGLYSGDRDQAYGSATGGGSEVMSSGNPDPVAFLVWETVFHRDIMLNPSVLAAGAAYAGGQFVMDLSSPGGVAAPSQIWPPAGASDVPTTFGGEWPTPLAPFRGARFPVGTPVTWRDYGAGSGTEIASPRFTLQAEPSGVVVPAYLLSPQNWTATDVSSTGVHLGTALALIPAAPLKPHTLYSARVSGTLTSPGRGSVPFERTWQFTTGDEVVPSPPGFARPVLPKGGAGTLLVRPAAPTAPQPAAGADEPHPSLSPESVAATIGSGFQPPAATPSSAATPSPATNPSPAPTSSPATNPSSGSTSSPATNPSSAPTSSPATNPSSGSASSPATNPSSAPTSSPGTSPSSGSTSSPATNPSSAATPSPATNPSSAATPSVDVSRRLAELRGRIGQVKTGPRFTDLWKARWAAQAIEALAATGVIHGIGSDMFNPEGTLTRAQMAVALSNLVPSPARAAVAGALPPWSVRAVRQVAAEGWMGAPGAAFRPEELVSRSAAIQALTRMMGWTPQAKRYAESGGAWPKGVAPPGVPAGQSRDDLLWAAHVRLLRGNDGRIAPQADLTRAQFAVLLFRLLEQTAP